MKEGRVTWQHWSRDCRDLATCEHVTGLSLISRLLAELLISLLLFHLWVPALAGARGGVSRLGRARAGVRASVCLSAVTS